MKFLIKILLIFLSTFSPLTLAKSLEITEIHPNPIGKDSGNEWIEIRNKSTTSTELKNWTIKNSRDHLIESDKILKAGEIIILDKLKISLRNKNETISLISPEGKVVKSLHYKDAPEGLSYAQIIIEGEATNWQWQKPSKGKANPEYSKITGSITEYRNKDLLINQQILNLKQNFNPLLAKIFLKRGRKIELLINQENEIQKLRILNSSK